MSEQNIYLMKDAERFIELLGSIERPDLDQLDMMHRKVVYGWTGRVESYDGKPIGIVSEPRGLGWYVGPITVIRVWHYYISPEELWQLEEGFRQVDNSTALYVAEMVMTAKRLMSEGYELVGLRTWNVGEGRLFPMTRVGMVVNRRWRDLFDAPWATTVQPEADCYSKCRFSRGSHCGYYSYKLTHFLQEAYGLLSDLYTGAVAMGIVVHFGTVYEAEGGYRSSRARIKEVWCNAEKLDVDRYPGVRIHHVERRYDPWHSSSTESASQ